MFCNILFHYCILGTSTCNNKLTYTFFGFLHLYSAHATELYVHIIFTRRNEENLYSGYSSWYQPMGQ